MISSTSWMLADWVCVCVSISHSRISSPSFYQCEFIRRLCVINSILVNKYFTRTHAFHAHAHAEFRAALQLVCILVPFYLRISSYYLPFFCHNVSHRKSYTRDTTATARTNKGNNSNKPSECASMQCLHFDAAFMQCIYV